MTVSFTTNLLKQSRQVKLQLTRYPAKFSPIDYKTYLVSPTPLNRIMVMYWAKKKLTSKVLSISSSSNMVTHLVSWCWCLTGKSLCVVHTPQNRIVVTSWDKVPSKIFLITLVLHLVSWYHISNWKPFCIMEIYLAYFAHHIASIRLVLIGHWKISPTPLNWFMAFPKSKEINQPNFICCFKLVLHLVSWYHVGNGFDIWLENLFG